MQLAARSPTFVALVKAAAVLTVVFSLVTFADHLHRYVELFSHFRLQYLYVALLLAVVLTVLRCRAWGGVMLLLAFVNALPVTMWYFAETASAPGATTIKLLHANVFFENNETDRLLSLIRRENPDVVFLQEVNGRWIRSLGALREEYPHHLEVPQEDKFGIAAYTRDPDVDIQVVTSPPFDLPTLVMRLAVGGQIVTLVSTHPMPPLGEPAYDARNKQLESIGELVKQIEGPKVLIGDLNTTMWSHHYETLLQKTGLSNTRYGFGTVPSWPAQLPFALIPIDHCLVSDEFAALDTRAGPRIGSDHLPLIVELALLQ